MDYLSVAEVRDEFGDDVQDLTDRAIVRKIDRLSGTLEEALGHSFGRAVMAMSTAADQVQVSTTALIIGGDTYTFAVYTTLGALIDAVNVAGKSYVLSLFPKVVPSTPSTLLKPAAAAACGPTYDLRRVLNVSALYLQLSGGKSHLFLPLPIQNITSVIESGLTLEATDYWAVPGETWLIRKRCSCVTIICQHYQHPHGRWLGSYPGNITVTYVPFWWNTVPGVVKQALIESFASDAGTTPVRSESFGEYSYTRDAPVALIPRDILAGPNIRPYAVRFHP